MIFDCLLQCYDVDQIWQISKSSLLNVPSTTSMPKKRTTYHLLCIMACFLKFYKGVTILLLDPVDFFFVTQCMLCSGCFILNGIVPLCLQGPWNSRISTWFLRIFSRKANKTGAFVAEKLKRIIKKSFSESFFERW